MSGLPHNFATYSAGNFPAQDWMDDWNFVANLGNIYCTASGTANAIALTPALNSPNVTGYQNGTKYTFIAANTNTGPVTAQIGNLAALAVFNISGGQVSAASTIVGSEYYELIYISSLNSGAGGFILLTFSASGGGGLGIGYTMVTASGNYTVQSTDVIILMNKTVGAATSIIAPTSASRSQPIIVKDYKGDANTNNITFVPNGVETVDGFSPSTAASNGTALVDINNGAKWFYPLVSGGWYVLCGG